MPRLPLESFDVQANLYGGQAFLWRPAPDGWHYGVLQNQPARLRWREPHLEYEGASESALRCHLRLDDDLESISRQLSRDPVLAEAIRSTRGLRLLRLEPWEGLVSFVCGSFSSIPRITRKVQNLSARFGEPLPPFHGVQLHSLPDPAKLARASLAQLRACNLGYRDKYAKGVARAVASGRLVPEELARLPYEEARARLLELPGVGEKVADCVCLFGLGKTESFPIDVWIERALRTFYGRQLRARFPREPLTYARLSLFARERWGPLAGYAQNHLFTHARRTLARGS